MTVSERNERNTDWSNGGGVSAEANQEKAFILNSMSYTRGSRSQDTLTTEKYFNHFNPNNGHFQGKTHSRQIAPTTHATVLNNDRIAPSTNVP